MRESRTDGATWIDEAATRFERDWTPSRRPRIEDYLAEAAESLRPRLLEELLKVERELLERAGESPESEEFETRDQAGVIPSGATVEDKAGPRESGRLDETMEGGLRTTSLDDDGCPKQLSAEGADVKTWFKVPGYDILSRLGAGGMGVVYKARHHRLNRQVALKMIRAGVQASSDELARFLVEAEVVARLDHPNVLKIYEIGEFDGLPFVALELLEGGTLADRLAGAPQPRRSAAETVATMARAIHAAHRANIIHRDLKPSNVLFSRDGTLKIVDFGLAKRLETDGHTLSLQVMGTPSYMAPEQARGQTRDVGPATDVYALGAVLYEMLTGRPPFKGVTATETIWQVIHEEPLPPSRLHRVPRDLETICLKCLAKEPHRRYASAEDLAEDLGRFLAGESIRGRRTPHWERGMKWARRRPTTATLLAVGVATTVALTALGIQYRHSVRLKQRQEDQQASILRARSAEAILKGQEAIAREDWENGRLILSDLITRLEGRPRLADLRAAAVDLSGRIDRGREVQEGRRADRSKRLRFLRLRDEALFHDTQFAGLDQADDAATTRRAARAALDVFAAWKGDAWEMASPPPSLSSRERDEIKEGCYELLLVWADATSRTPSVDARRRADEALRILDSAAKLRPAPTMAFHLRRAECLALKGDAAGSVREAAIAGRLSPSGAFDRFLYGRDLYKRRFWARAIPHLDAALREQPDHFWALCLLAICDLQMQRPAEARAVLNSCLRLRSDFAWLYLLRGYAHGQMGASAPGKAGGDADEATGLFEAAEQDYRRAETLLRPADKELNYVLLVNRGTMRFQRGRLPAAEADLRRAIRKNPHPYLAYATLAQVCRREDKLDEAIEQAGLAIDRKPEMASLYRLRATLHMARKRGVSSALGDLEAAAVREAPGSPAAAGDHAKRAELLYRGGRSEEALDAAESALRVVPDLAEGHRWRVASLLELGRYDDVISSCDRCLSKGSPSAELLAIRGMARSRRGDLAGAIEDYTHALSLRPGQAKVHAQRGWAYLISNAPGLALHDFDKSLRLDPTDVDSGLGRANALVLLRRRGEAVSAAEAALRLGEPTSRALYNAARVYALAANLTAADSSRGGSAETTAKHLDRSQALLGRALEKLPDAERASFLKEKILQDPAFSASRRRHKFTELIVRFGRTPR